jgi:16S rRNA (cytosine967-C5)-methyltransferase
MVDAAIPGLAAREAARVLLGEVLISHRRLDEVFNAAVAPLPPRDRAFARLLVATVLRRLGQIDAALAARLERPLSKKNRWVQDVLRLGAAQLLFIGTSAHAAVACAVSQCEGAPPLKGLVNAVLRRIASDGVALTEAQDAARLNTPAWLWQSWEEAHGAAATRAIAEAHLGEPPRDLTVAREPSKWAGRLGARQLPWGSLRIDRPTGAVEDLPGYAEGAWWVQDAAAALPATLLLAAHTGAGVRVLDLCAAPGGKTAQLAAAGARVTALDRASGRIERLGANLRRLKLDAEVVTADAATWRPPEPYPAVLLDAPCTATGTVRRHPDIPRLKRAGDVAHMSDVQDKLLDAAAAMLAPGGTLVYCVCSLEPEECEPRIARLLDARASLRRAPIRAAELGGHGELLTAAGDLRSLPCHLAGEGGLDGFYAARLRRET